MPKIEGKYGGESPSGKAIKIDGNWVPKSQMKDVKQEGDKISCTVPDWLSESYDKEMKHLKKREEKKKNADVDVEPLMIYGNCKVCGEKLYITVSNGLCIGCICGKGTK